MDARPFFLLSGILALVAGDGRGQPSPTDLASIRGGELPQKWITGGPRCAEVPDWQVQEYNEDLYILRESGCTDYEKPFLYLFFGKERALLEDTGSDVGPLAGPLNWRRRYWSTGGGTLSTNAFSLG